MSSIATGREIVQTVREENVPFMAASIAYYAIAPIVPLLALSLAVLSTFGGTASRYAAYGYLGALLLFVTALYLAAIVLLLGVVVNATLDW